MRCLLDTHAFFWAATSVRRLSPKVQSIIADDQNVVGVSIASFWEMAIKASIGKWDLPLPLTDLRRFAETENIAITPITVDITEVVRSLPMHHGDPFDRIIIATALEESWSVLSVDDQMDRYAGLQRIWL